MRYIPQITNVMQFCNLSAFRTILSHVNVLLFIQKVKYEYVMPHWLIHEYYDLNSRISYLPSHQKLCSEYCA